ncbi:MAG TPA: hypothetical protein VK666_26150 [Chryseolinea sp.]|nr:hypothetical protein [Chryseolinea sp.]
MIVRYHSIFLAIFFICGSFCKLSAQDVIVHSGFFRDSLAIGDETGYYLSARYPSQLNILFPDSTFNFAPFEYQRKTYFPTQTQGGKSYDSVIYYLSTFEIAPLQSLSLPVFQLNPMDCTVVVSRGDTVRLSEFVKDLPDSLTAQNIPLKVNTAYQNVAYLFNYPLLIIGVGGLLFIAILGWLIFGKRISRHYRLKKMQKLHQKFMDGYTRQLENIRQAFSAITIEDALFQWKKYVEQLESRPYTKLTTREITRMDNNEPLGRDLHMIDGAIYGHDTNVLEPLEHLKAYAHQRFLKKMEEVKHG